MAKNKHRPHPSPAAASDDLHDEPAADDVTPAGGFADGGDDEGGLPAEPGADGLVPAGAPAGGATPVTLPTGLDEPPAAAPGVADLQAQIDALKSLVEATQKLKGTGGVPDGFKLVRDDGPTQDQKSLAEQAAIKAELERGVQARTQAHCDKMFPEGKHVFRCVLAADKNGHPELLVRAANPTDATARYLAACGVNHTEHKVVVARV